MNLYMNKIITILSTSLFVLVPVSGNEIDSLIAVLDSTMEIRYSYMAEKESRIGGLKSLLEKSGITPEETYAIHSLLYEEYVKYNFDSTLYYINRNLDISEKLNRTHWRIETSFLLSHLLSASGMYRESLEILDSIDPAGLTDRQKLEFYSCSRHVYAELGMYTIVQSNAEAYYEIAGNYTDSLLNKLDHESEEYLLLSAAKLVNQGLVVEARAINSRLLSRVHENSPEYAHYTFERAISYRLEGNREMEKHFLVRSAIADIRSAVKDNVSLTLLAIMLYEDREIDRAYRYINFSLEDATFYNARLRFLEISRILPLISEAYQVKSDRQRTDLKYYSLVITILAIFLVLGTLFMFLQMRRLSKARQDLQEANRQLTGLSSDLSDANSSLKILNQELSDSNHLKEEYIGFFLNMCSEYIDKLEDYRKMVNRKIVGGQYESLFVATKSTDQIDMELSELYDSFDKIFLHLFPDFVEQFNQLILKEERIILKVDEHLNTELRIFALIRLGITDSSRIASFLRYSVNTIYNYRTKIRNKARIPRDAFEREVRMIGGS